MGTEALGEALSGRVEILLLEISLGEMSGYEVCKIVREELGDSVTIFFLSEVAEPSDRVAGLLLGADDFVAKPFDSGELLARIARFARRRDVARAGNGVAPEVEESVHLTPREHEVLGLLALGRAQKEIARELSISCKTVSTHIQHLLTKLESHSRAELVAHAYRQGLVSPLYDRRATREAALV